VEVGILPKLKHYPEQVVALVAKYWRCDLY